MGFVWCRVIVKLVSFAFLAEFVLLFVVYGYRYDTVEQSIKQMNSYVQIQFWSDNHDIRMNDKVFQSNDKRLNLYHLESGCYTIDIDNELKNICIEENSAIYMSFVTVKAVVANNQEHLMCLSLDSRDFGKNCISDTCFSQSITNAFLFQNIHFVKTVDTLWYCSKDFKNCKFLYPTEKEVICGTSDGLVLSDGSLLQLQ